MFNVICYTFVFTFKYFLMFLGVRTMHRAYVTSPGNQSHSLSNVKYGYKECTQNMCNIEAQLEAMMGTFNCKLKGKDHLKRLNCNT
jgi:hypothetical protein